MPSWLPLRAPSVHLVADVVGELVGSCRPSRSRTATTGSSPSSTRRTARWRPRSVGTCSMPSSPKVPATTWRAYRGQQRSPRTDRGQGLAQPRIRVADRTTVVGHPGRVDEVLRRAAARVTPWEGRPRRRRPPRRAAPPGRRRPPWPADRRAGRDHEPGRHRQAGAGELTEVGALATRAGNVVLGQVLQPGHQAAAVGAGGDHRGFAALSHAPASARARTAPKGRWSRGLPMLRGHRPVSLGMPPHQSAACRLVPASPPAAGQQWSADADAGCRPGQPTVTLGAGLSADRDGGCRPGQLTVTVGAALVSRPSRWGPALAGDGLRPSPRRGASPPR